MSRLTNKEAPFKKWSFAYPSRGANLSLFRLR